MNRRAVLHTLGSGAVIGLAGCATRIDGSSDDPDSTDQPPSTPISTDTTTETPNSLPFRDSGGDRTLLPATASFANESPTSERVTFSVSHDGEEFFAETYELDSGSGTESPPLVAAQGEYDVRVTAESGAETTDVWRIRGWWPKYEVRVTEGRELLAGCKLEGESHSREPRRRVAHAETRRVRRRH